MVHCKLHPDAGTLIRLKGPHIGAYCKQCGKWLKWIAIDDIDKCIKPELDVEFDSTTTQSDTPSISVEQLEPSEDNDDVPW